MKKSLLLICSLCLCINSFSYGKTADGKDYRLLILGLYINGISIGDDIVYTKKKVFM